MSDSTVSYQPPAKDPSTTAHPPPGAPDPTLTKSVTGSSDNFTTAHDAARRQSASTTTSPTQLSDLRLTLRSALRQFPDFPQPGILFEDILPIFANPKLHENLIQALEIHINDKYGADNKPDVIMGLEARGFLFGPSLALRIGAAFVPVRKEGKLPGPTVTVGYEKEYGSDNFQMQADGIQKGQKVLIVDDIIATGGTAAAAGSLVKKLGGDLLGYLFILELDFLKGRAKLDAPVFTLLASQEEK